MASVQTQNTAVRSLSTKRELGPITPTLSYPNTEVFPHGRGAAKLSRPPENNNLRASRRDSGLDSLAQLNLGRDLGDSEDIRALGDRQELHHAKDERIVDKVEPKAEAPGQFNVLSVVNHRTEYLSVTSDQLLPVNETERTFSSDGRENRGAFEIVTIYRTLASKWDRSVKALLPLSDLCEVRITIYSPAILTSLRSVVEYYPGYDLGQPTTIFAPYSILFHHRKELEERREQFATPSDDDHVPACESEINTYEHLSLLLEFMKRESYVEIEREEERYRRAVPVVTFDMLWLLFKPGTDVYYNLGANTEGLPRYDAYVIKNVTGGIRGDSREPYTIELWYLEFDGEYIDRSKIQDIITPFDGEREINSLPIIPVRFMRDELLGDSLPRQERIEKGKLFFQLAKSRLCMDYAGANFDAAVSTYEGRVVIDDQLFYAQPEHAQRGINKPSLEVPRDSMIRGMACYCACCKTLQRDGKTKNHPFSAYDEISPHLTRELTEHQYFLLTRVVIGYGLDTLRWEILDINYLSRPHYDSEMINTLVAPEDFRTLLKAVANSFEQDYPKSASLVHDSRKAFVQKKGQGKVVLLHGPPGVGKSHSAICVAEYVQRPLLKLACGDIGNDAMAAEYYLAEAFRRAKAWGAIILIDEADVYLERRITQDLRRNALVSVLLRMCETYSGLLILTTNRIGTFDDAFISRIHLVLHYEELQDQGREDIWRSCFNSLEIERDGKITILESAKDYAIGNKEVKELSWNGREIKNAVQVAVAIADNTPKERGKTVLMDTHIALAVKKSAAFKKYLEKLHHATEAKRAATARIRDDSLTAL